MNIQKFTEWDDYKDLLITKKNLTLQYKEYDSYYDIWAEEGSTQYEISLTKGTADATNFEDNYRTASNWAIGQRAHSFTTSDFQFNGDSVLATVPKNTTVNIDFAIPGTPGSFQYINGAVAITNNAVFGDYASAYVIDIDNLLGYGANTILASYVSKWYIDPAKSLDIMTPYAGKLPAGVYLRVVYTSAGLVNDVGVAINYRLHTPI